MSLDKIVKDDYGQVMKITFTDVDTDTAADVSSYTTAQQMIFTDPAGLGCAYKPTAGDSCTSTSTAGDGCTYKASE